MINQKEVNALTGENSRSVLNPWQVLDTALANRGELTCDSEEKR